MKIAFIGSRNFCDKKFVQQKVDDYLMDGWVDFVSKEIPNELVSGGAKGVDSWAEQIGRDIGAICWIYPPDYLKHGNSACAIRNQLIVDDADLIVAFWDGKSRGTKMSIDMALKASKQVDIYVR